MTISNSHNFPNLFPLQGTVLILRDQIVKLQEANHAMEKDETIRQKSMKIHELQRMLDETKEECRSSAQERETLTSSLSQVRVKTDEAVERLRDKAIVAEAAKQGAEERLSHAISESDRKDALMRSARQSQEEMSTQLDFARRQLVSSETGLLTLRSEHAREMEDLTIAFQAERGNLLEQLDSLTVKLHTALDSQRRAQRETAEVQVRCESLESDMRRTHLAAVQQLNKKIGSLELHLVDMERDSRTAQESREASLAVSNNEIEMLRSEVARFKREKETLHDKVRELEHACEGERRKVTALKRDQSSRREYFDLDLKEERNKIGSLEAEVMLSKIKEAELSSQKGEMERKLAEQSAIIASLNTEAKGRLSSITGRRYI